VHDPPCSHPAPRPQQGFRGLQRAHLHATTASHGHQRLVVNTPGCPPAPGRAIPGIAPVSPRWRRPGSRAGGPSPTRSRAGAPSPHCPPSGDSRARRIIISYQDKRVRGRPLIRFRINHWHRGTHTKLPSSGDGRVRGKIRFAWSTPAAVGIFLVSQRQRLMRLPPPGSTIVTIARCAPEPEKLPADGQITRRLIVQCVHSGLMAHDSDLRPECLNAGRAGQSRLTAATDPFPA
jgi:hypothetical protein